MKMQTREREEMIRRKFEDFRQHICEQLNALIKLSDQKQGQERLQDTQSMLGTIPMTSSELELAKRRVMNFRRYMRSGEIGAAKYEVRMLLGMLDEVGAIIRRRDVAKLPTVRKPLIDDSMSWSHSCG